MANVQLAVAGDDTTQVILSVPGVQGPAGSNLPASGTTNQILFKQSNTDYDTAWSFVTNAMVDSSAAIAGTKISPNFGSQNVVTTGTSTAASFIPTSSSVPTNGVYLPSANNVAISSSGTQRVNFGTGEVVFNETGENYDFRIEGDTEANLVFVDASTNRVGLGTSSVGYRLTVDNINQSVAAISVNGNDQSNARIRISNGGSGGRNWELTSGLTGANNSFFSIYDQTAAASRLVVDDQGRVAIGTTGPNVPLETAGANGTISIFRTNNATAANNAGGGFDAAASATASSRNAIMWLDADGANFAGSDYFYIQKNGNSGSVQIVQQSNAAMEFHTNGSPRAQIDSSGRLLVGTSTSTGSNNWTGLVVRALTGFTDPGEISLRNGYNVPGIINGNDIGSVLFQGSGGETFGSIKCTADAAPGTNDYPGRLVFSVTPDGGSSPTTSPSAMTINSGQEVLIGYSTDNGAYKLQVNSQIFATSATIATSDGRYKENVVTLDGCVDLVKALRPVSFDWKAQQPITRVDEDGETVVVREAHNFPDGKQVGFIAQEVEKVLADKPWLGSVIKQNVRPAVTDNDGNELAPEEEFLGIAEGNLVAVLTSALKDAIGRIESLEAEVAAIKT